MFKGKDVSWLALVGALAVAPVGSALGADSTTTPDPATMPAAATDTAPAAAERKGDDVTVIQVDPAAPAKAEGTLADLVPGQVTAEEIIGKSVANANGDTIGEITDLVLDNEKAVYAVLSVGGFLGIGADYVAVPFEKIQITTTADGDNRVQLIANVTEDDLKALAEAQQRGDTTADVGRSTPAPATDTPAVDTETTTTTTTTTEATTEAPLSTDETMTTDTAADGSATTDTVTTDTALTTDTTVTTDTAVTADPSMDEAAPAAGGTADTQVAAAYANMTADDLIGKTVVNSAGDTIGEINDLVIDDQKVVMAVVSVGGFLGIGAKDVAVPLEQLTLSEDKATLASGLTKEDLETMPAYEKGKLRDIEKGKPLFGNS